MKVVIQYEIGFLFTVQIVPLCSSHIRPHLWARVFSSYFRVIFGKHKEIWEIRTMTDASSSQYSTHIAVPGSAGVFFSEIQKRKVDIISIQCIVWKHYLSHWAILFALSQINKKKKNKDFFHPRQFFLSLFCLLFFSCELQEFLYVCSPRERMHF